jgi:N-acetylglucosamine-6-phosphate deacetylase
MFDGEISGWFYSSREPVCVRWRNGIITEIESVDAEEAGDLWIAPALVDLQVNGFAGIDFQRDTLTQAEMIAAVTALRAAGCGRFLLTLMTDDWDVLMRRLAHLRRLRAEAPQLAAAIAGFHVEGPFLS